MPYGTPNGDPHHGGAINGAIPYVDDQGGMTIGHYYYGPDGTITYINNGPDSSGGGIGAFGNAGTGNGTPTSTTPGTTPPSNTGGLLGGSTGDWLKFILGLYAAYQANNTSFKAVPEDPSLVALRQKFLGYVNNSPTRNMLGDMLKGQLQHTSNTPYQIPQGIGGYNPYPQGNSQPQYDLSKIFPNIASSGNVSPTGA